MIPVNYMGSPDHGRRPSLCRVSAVARLHKITRGNIIVVLFLTA